MTAVLEIEELSKSFGGVQAICNFSLCVEPRRIYGLIGPNGAGKTTIFNTITGIYQPTEGTIKFEGRDITGSKPYQVAQLGVGRTFQNIRLFTNLSVLDNVYIACHMDANYGLLETMLRLPKFRKTEQHLKDKAMSLLELVGLQDEADAIAGSLPYGHQRKLEIARSLALNPRLVLLDEPAAGMNAEESTELVAFIRALYEKFDLTILMIEHHMDVVMKLCQEIAVLDFGRKIAQGTPAEIKATPCVIEAYLGGEMPC